MRLGFLGSPSLAVPVLDALVAAGHDVAVVVSRPDRRRGRGGSASPTAVKAAALGHGIEVTDDLSALLETHVDLSVVVAYGAMVPTAILDRAPMLNVHLSLLPRWRGAAPVERAILAGDVRTGVSVMRLEPTLDTGPVYAVAETDVDAKHLAALQAELVALGTALLVPMLAGTPADLPEPTAQVGEATYAHKVADHELELDFTKPASEVARVVRLGRARTWAGDTRLGVLDAVVVDDARGDAGHFDGSVVTCGVGGLLLVAVVPAGRRAMSPEAWLRGIRDDLPTRLGRAGLP